MEKLASLTAPQIFQTSILSSGYVTKNYCLSTTGDGTPADLLRSDSKLLIRGSRPLSEYGSGRTPAVVHNPIIDGCFAAQRHCLSTAESGSSAGASSTQSRTKYVQMVGTTCSRSYFCPFPLNGGMTFHSPASGRQSFVRSPGG